MGRYDVAVIGGGIAGLACANYLARGGKRVILLEQNHQAGGCMSGFWRQGYYFDGGDQSFESGGIVFPMLKELGVYDQHEWHKIEYRLKTAAYEFIATSIDEAEQKMLEAFPDETGIKDVFREVRGAAEFMMEIADPWHVHLIEKPSLRNIYRFLKRIPELKRWVDPEYKNEVCKAIKDENLRNWFSNAGYKGMPFLLFAGFWYSWVHDYWYPAGGIQSLMNSMVDKLKELGGEAKFKIAVNKILVKNGRVVGVLTEDGEKFDAEYVVYTGDYKRFVSNILGEEYFEPEFVKKVKETGVTEALVAVFLGVNIPPEELKKILQAHHVIYLPTFDVIFPDENSDIDIHSRMWMEITCPTLENPKLSPPGKSSLVLQTFSSAKWQSYWKNKNEDTKRTPEYQELKKKVGMQLVETAGAIIPDLSSKIDYMDVGTPLSSIRFTRNTEGASAGWSYGRSESSIIGKWGFVQIRTPVKGLYAAGHYTMWPGGVPIAAITGKIAANFILKKRPFAQIEMLYRLFGR